MSLMQSDMIRSAVAAETIMLQTSGRVGGGRVPCVGHDEEGLDEGAQGIDNVPKHLGGVLLHVVGLAKGARGT